MLFAEVWWQSAHSRPDFAQVRVDARDGGHPQVFAVGVEDERLQPHQLVVDHDGPAGVAGDCGVIGLADHERVPHSSVIVFPNDLREFKPYGPGTLLGFPAAHAIADGGGAAGERGERCGCG